MNSSITTSFPEGLRSLIGAAPVIEIHDGMSEARVFRVESGDGEWYVKVARRGVDLDLCAESARLIWLQGKLSVPRVRYFAEHEDAQFLMMTALPGVPLYHDSLRDRTAQIVGRYAEGLHLIHALPISACPFDARLQVMLSEAHRRLLAGAVDTEDFDDERRGRSPDSLYRELQETCPTEEDLVFTHGDYCVPNVLVDPSTLQLTGFVDWGRAGIADRYQDLALAARSIARNFGKQWVKGFFKAYGIREPDESKVRFYKLLDEFF